jgi:ferric-dicitrate binding protein FerR (iron transport regulator)
MSDELSTWRVSRVSLSAAEMNRYSSGRELVLSDPNLEDARISGTLKKMF